MDDRQKAVKDYLSRYRRYQVHLYIAEIEIRDAKKDLAELIESPTYGSVRIRKARDELRELLKQIIKRERTREEESRKGMKEIQTTIESVKDPTQREILMRRYVKGEDWATISEAVYYSLEYTHRLHRAGLSDIADQKKIGE